MLVNDSDLVFSLAMVPTRLVPWPGACSGWVTGMAPSSELPVPSFLSQRPPTWGLRGF